MLSYADALERVQRILDERHRGAMDRCKVIEDESYFRNWGWVIPYQNSFFLKTGRDDHMLFDNSPFYVNKYTEEIGSFENTGRGTDFYIAEYEKTLPTELRGPDRENPRLQGAAESSVEDSQPTSASAGQPTSAGRPRR